MAIAEIHITLKPGLFDAQGTTVTKALHQLGYAGVKSVSIGKFMSVELDDAMPSAQMQAQLERMCRQLLANPVIEDFEITIEAPPVAPGTGSSAPTVVAASPLSEHLQQIAPPSTMTPSEQIAAGAISTSTAATPEPFAMSYAQYNAMPPADRLAIQEIAWTRHSAIILNALSENRATWVLIQGGKVIESGPTLDTYPTEQRLAARGGSNDLVPWVFTRPT